METRKCSVEGCENPLHSRGWCIKHYTRVRNHGDPRANKNPLFRYGCTVDTCQGSHHSNGLCSAHYAKQRRKRGIPISSRYRKSKNEAEHRALDFTISLDEYADIVKRPCYYCSSPIMSSQGGLDRIDNSKGYVTGNVLPCCGSCNSIRGDKLTVDEMKAAMLAVLEFRRRAPTG